MIIIWIERTNRIFPWGVDGIDDDVCGLDDAPNQINQN